MFTPQICRHADPWGELTTRHLEGSIVESVHVGWATRSLLEQLDQGLPAVCDEVPSLRWLIDLSGLTGADADCRIAGSQVFRTFRARGGEVIAFVLRQGAVRMVIAAAAFATGAPVAVFESRDEALAFLRARAGVAPARAATRAR